MCKDTPEYSEFACKRDQWIEWLSGKDPHSITNQIIQMVWDAAVWRVINEARGLAPDAEEGGVQLNGDMHRLIDRTSFQSQAAAIRRLMDKSRVTGNRGVYSLYGLIDNMQQHAHLMTREHLFAAEALEYDYEPVRKARDQYVRKEGSGGKTALVPRSLWWEDFENRHRDIDLLCGVDERKRSKGDSISPERFVRLKRKLGVCNDVVNYVDKFIAHAATPGSRAIIDAEEPRIALQHLWDAHEAIYKVAHFIGIYLLGGNGQGGLPVPQYDHLKYIDRPLVALDDVPHLGKTWQAYDLEVRDWGQWGLDEFDAGTR